jgi:outer membrane protein OmpA-like peptidoglycan-associated protein
VPVPKAEAKSSLPKWYPEKAWTAKEGQSQIFIEGKIVYDTGSATIHKFGESEKVLKTLLKFVTDHPEVTRVRVEGHTDDRGDDGKNEELSARRSLSVCNWLVDNGVSHLRLLAVGFGERKPLGPNELAEGRAENRRTEFHVAEVDGKPYMGRDPTGGGLAIDVPSLEERQREEEERKKGPQRAVVPTLKFKATGNEVKKVKDRKMELDPTQSKPKP